MVAFLNCHFLFFILFFLSTSSIHFFFHFFSLVFSPLHVYTHSSSLLFLFLLDFKSLSLSLSLLDSRTLSSSLCDKKQRKNKQEISCLLHRWSKDIGRCRIDVHCAKPQLLLCHRLSSSPNKMAFVFLFFFSFFFAFIVMIWLILRLCFWVCILIMLEFRDV